MRLFLLAILFVVGFSANAQYTEVMDPNGLTKNLHNDYGVQTNAPDLDQSEAIQQAIDDLAAQGGGRLIFPKGEYRFANVVLRSNIHLLIEAGTVLRPEWPEGTKVVLFEIDADYKDWRKDPRTYIENVSIRGLGGRFVVDYSDRILRDKEGCRAVLLTMVKNFLIQDMDVKDNYSTYCGITLTPVKVHPDYTVEQVHTWPVSRPTNGTIRNCRHFHASPGYGLVQLHGAQSVYFEKLYSMGGVTLRLETGANTENIGVYDITGKHIYCENGRAALMLGPHSAKNGVVKVDSIVAKSCEFAVTVGMGGVKEDAPDQTPGYFSSESKITNIHVIFGKNAQVKNQSILWVPVEYYNDLKLWPDDKFLTAPSIGAVKDDSENYDVTIENVTMEGFKYYSDKKILTEADVRPGDKWDEWDKWKTDFLDNAHRTSNGAVIEEYSIPEKTIMDQPIQFRDVISGVLRNSLQKSNSLQIYPNPVRDYCRIQWTNENTGRVSVSIYADSGRKISSQTCSDCSGMELNVSDLSPGLYYVSVRNSLKPNSIVSSKLLKL